MYNPNYEFFAPKGWQCPKCGRVYSPTTSMCFYCNNNNSPIVVTDKTTPINNPSLEKTSAIKENVPDWSDWLAQVTTSNWGAEWLSNSTIEEYQKYLNKHAINIFDYPNWDKPSETYKIHPESITYFTDTPTITVKYDPNKEDIWFIN